MIKKTEIQTLLEKLKAEGITDSGILDAMAQVPRAKFVLESEIERAYDNTALPIDCQQTISQPYIVAHMSQLLFNQDTKHKMNKVLEIGTGSGYQTAILCQLAQQVYTIERIEQLYTQAKNLLSTLNYKNIHFRHADGNQGWPEAAPFDGIMVTAATPIIPPALLEQLNPDYGRLILPLGNSYIQNLVVISRKGDQYHQEVVEKVRFVPLKPGLE